MMKSTSNGLALAFTLLSACSDEEHTTTTTLPPAAPACDIQNVLERTGCSNEGCHGVQNVANLDLLSPGVERRLVGVTSETDACRGRALVDPEAPGSSLLLELIDPERPVSCSVPMPFGATGVATEDVACFEAWVDQMVADFVPEEEPGSPFDAADAESVAAKVKTLAHGGPLTAEELQAVVDGGQAGLRTQLDAWMLTDQFRRKMEDFLLVELQQEVKGLIGLQFAIRDIGPLQENLEEMMLRTGWRLIERGEPWTRILTTRRWDVTTAILSGLRFTDEVLGRDTRFGEARLLPEDYTDWRVVELADAEEGASLPDFRDLAALRQVEARLALNIPRVGFFSSPAFLANAETNVDNAFRVTTNQTLIAALGRDFSAADPTPELSLAGLAPEASDPESTCFGCHRLLDPMRLYFEREYSIFYRRTDAPSAETPAFAFGGTQSDGEGMVDLAEALGSHPLFARAWTEKLCQWATSERCVGQDPELVRVAEAFTASSYDFRVLVRELLTSPVVTGAAPSESYRDRPFIVSITRQMHLCRLLDARLGTSDVCEDPALEGVLGLVPDDDFSRGKVDRVQTALGSAFQFAGAEQICVRLAERVIGPRGSPFDEADPSGSLDAFVEDLMSLPSNHSRRARVRAGLEAHFDSARARGASEAVALRSAFVVACESPDVMGLGL
ncbi:MAG: DUF1585 domain-containing protein [Myxococcota bacterium]